MALKSLEVSDICNLLIPFGIAPKASPLILKSVLARRANYT